MSDRTGYLVHLLRVLLLRINVYTHTRCLKLKRQAALKAAHPLTPQRGQKSLKYTREVCSSHFCDPYLSHDVHLCTSRDTTSTVTPQPRFSAHGAGHSTTLPARLSSFTVPYSNWQWPGCLCRHLWQGCELRHGLPNTDEPQPMCLLHPGQDRRISHRPMLVKAIGGSHREHHDSTTTNPSSLLPSQVQVRRPQTSQNCR